MKSDSGKSPARVAGLESTMLARYQGPENRALSTDAEFLETWHYGVETLPREIPRRPVDVHYVTKKSGGKNVLQRDIASNSALGAARKA